MKEGNNMKDTTSYVVKDIDKDIWKKFRGTCLLNGFDNANECLIRLINKYASGKISEKR